MPLQYNCPHTALAASARGLPAVKSRNYSVGLVFPISTYFERSVPCRWKVLCMIIFEQRGKKRKKRQKHQASLFTFGWVNWTSSDSWLNASSHSSNPQQNADDFALNFLKAGRLIRFYLGAHPVPVLAPFNPRRMTPIPLWTLGCTSLY